MTCLSFQLAANDQGRKKRHTREVDKGGIANISPKSVRRQRRGGSGR